MSSIDIEVTVIVISYNPDYGKLKRTIRSILYQTGLSLQIIVADDGSRENYFEQLDELFRMNGFDEYILLSSDCNHGTISNLMRTEEHVKGRYVKIISPGDYLYDEETLGKWYPYVSNKGIDVSFGNAVYYCYEDQERKLLSEYILPQNASLYTEDGNNRKSIILNYFLLKDAIVGALYLVRSEIMFKYLGRLEGIIVYTEDNMFRLMLMDGIRIVHYDEPVVYYEYGVGISTNKQKKWIDILEGEYQVVDKMISRSSQWDGRFNGKIKYLMGIKENERDFKLKKYLIFPQLLKWQIKKRFFKKYSGTDYSTAFLDKIHGDTGR